MKTFAAIDIGSYELEMKIYEMRNEGAIREVESVAYSLDLGSETFATGKLSREKVSELCRVLNRYKVIMDTYRVEDYKAYGTSAIRETENTGILLDQIYGKTGIKISVLSNSEQRFLDYKAVASKGELFDKIIQKNTAFVDIGGGSIQISLFEKDTLVTTQNMKLGVLRLQDYIGRLNVRPGKYETMVEEFISAQLSVFKKLYLKDRTIDNIIIVDDYISVFMERALKDSKEPCINAQDLESRLRIAFSKPFGEAASFLDMPEDSLNLLYISGILVNRIANIVGADKIWSSGSTLCDGIAYEYAESNDYIKPTHDFEQDIIACAKNISKRYMGSRRRSETLEKISLTIYDSMKDIHGLDERDRLLLRIASILHDCGKYISLMNLGVCSYNIIMSTEIIGLSHVEREIVANVVKYNHLAFDYYEDMPKTALLDKPAYLKISKLAAILKLANGLDRSQKQKFKDVTMEVKGTDLEIEVDSSMDITLERGLFANRAAFFEEVFLIKPVIRQEGYYL